VAQPLQNRRRRQGAGPRRRQLDRQGQAVQPATDLGHQRRRRRVQADLTPGAGGALQEERHRFRPGDERRVERPLVGQGQGRHGKRVLPREPQSLATCRQQRQPGTADEQPGQSRRRRQEVLAGVEQQQRPARPRPHGRRGGARPPGTGPQSQGPGGGGKHLLGTVQPGQRDEVHTTGELPGLSGQRRRPQRQARLAGAGRPGEGHQRRHLEQPAQGHQLPLPADEGGQGPGERRPVRGASPPPHQAPPREGGADEPRAPAPGTAPAALRRRGRRAPPDGRDRPDPDPGSSRERRGAAFAAGRQHPNGAGGVLLPCWPMPESTPRGARIGNCGTIRARVRVRPPAGAGAPGQTSRVERERGSGGAAERGPAEDARGSVAGRCDSPSPARPARSDRP
jgi:hypothetical protein